MNDLTHFIDTTPLVDTHEHLWTEEQYLFVPLDILRDLFMNYVPADLVVAGAKQEDVDALLTGSGDDIAGRFNKVRNAWERCLHTGYGEAVRILARRIYGIEEIT